MYRRLGGEGGGAGFTTLPICGGFKNWRKIQLLSRVRTEITSKLFSAKKERKNIHTLYIHLHIYARSAEPETLKALSDPSAQNIVQTN